MDYKLPEETEFDARGLGVVLAFTADQVRSAFLAGRLQGLEEGAKVCVSQMDPQDDGWDECLRVAATAIRSLKEET